MYFKQFCATSFIAILMLFLSLVKQAFSLHCYDCYSPEGKECDLNPKHQYVLRCGSDLETNPEVSGISYVFDTSSEFNRFSDDDDSPLFKCVKLSYKMPGGYPNLILRTCARGGFRCDEFVKDNEDECESCDTDLCYIQHPVNKVKLLS